VAFDHVIQIEVKPGLEILLPSPACMTIMKTLAWKDRGKATQVLGGSGGMPSAERHDAITTILQAFLSGLKG